MRKREEITKNINVSSGNELIIIEILLDIRDQNEIIIKQNQTPTEVLIKKDQDQ